MAVEMRCQSCLLILLCIESVDGITEMGKIEKYKKEFFEHLPDLFLDRFEQQFTVHINITRKWLHTKTIPIIIAGNPHFAKACICWIFNDDTNFPTNEIILNITS
jgi:hypothetical protein